MIEDKESDYGDHPYEPVNIDETLVTKKYVPVMTYLFLAINGLMWLVTLYVMNRYQIEQVYANLFLGAKYKPLIIEGEFWRLIMPIFLHGNIVHLAVNSYSLYAIGPETERVYGRKNFFYIYMLAGILGNVASFAFSNSLSVGASGAIFGLLGAQLILWIRLRKFISKSYGINLIAIILFNVFYGFSQGNIDNLGHIGGLLGGFLTAIGVGFTIERFQSEKKVLGLIVVILLIFGGIFIGLSTGV